MADLNSSIVRLFSPAELPVRITDWPADVGVALCCVDRRVIGLLPYHVSEPPMALRRRLLDEVGDRLRGFAVHPALKGIPDAKLPSSEDQRLRNELEAALRGMPRLIEEANDFAINYEFAAEEGLTLDALQDGKGREEAKVKATVVTEQLPVGYMPFSGEVATDCEVIAGAILKPLGAAGVDLILGVDTNKRAVPPEVKVLVREDSLRVAIPLGPVLEGGRLPPILRLPAGSIIFGASGGKPVAASVLRRGSLLFVAPDYGAVTTVANVVTAPRGPSLFSLKRILIALAALLVIAAIAAAVWVFVVPNGGGEEDLAPVQSLRSGLFSAPTE